MNMNSAFSLLNIRRQLLLTFQLAHPKNHYAKKDTGGVSMVGGMLKKKKMGKTGPAMEKKILPVETDPHKLVNFVCGSNILKEGQDIEIKPDSEYPEWLWTLRTGPPPKLEELDPNSLEYWRRVRRLGIQRNNRLAQLKKF
ncbi:39s ribosomal protein l54 mitochondrial [Holotrichia oblita]|uniref:39s ribosomal protein l54 mitochondrial n=2 Tax=Holotrichia oblita TaxID=644536 RepID=A0ACB9TQ91_HOLOL|nr:39s ribosomal protein l54 mitochondrial [Holotrichia oblita]KAI4468868.1 39s ribosomal protein l54 mitochondrial [Holotrichia oblita]